MKDGADNNHNRLTTLMPVILNLCSDSLQSSTEPQTNISERYFNERLYAAEYINDEEIPNFSLARCRVEPGITTQLHRLSVNEWYVVESGEGRMELDSQEQDIKAGAIVQIPKGVNQRVSNTGEADLIFFCICIPRFTPQTYSTDE